MVAYLAMLSISEAHMNGSTVRVAQGSVEGVLFAGGMLIAVILAVVGYLSYSKLAHRRCCDEGKLRRLQMELGAHDQGTALHSKRVGELASALLKELDMPEMERRIVRLAAQLHDIGKTTIPVSILTKAGQLTEGEWELVRQHSVLGASLLKDRGFCDEIVEIVRSHHERWDGRGYPMGLHGRQIPLGSRVLSVVDGFDAMTSDRAYRRAMHLDDALYHLRQGSGTQWDPNVVEAFLRIGIPSTFMAGNDDGKGLHRIGDQEGVRSAVGAGHARASLRKLAG